jgi:hypothetical protein
MWEIASRGILWDLARLGTGGDPDRGDLSMVKRTKAQTGCGDFNMTELEYLLRQSLTGQLVIR